MKYEYDEDTIHIIMGLYDKNGSYSRHAAVTIASLWRNTKATVIVHILHDNTLTERNKNKFIKMAEKFEQTIEFHKVNVSYDVSKNTDGERLSKGALFRLKLLEVIPDEIKRIIYLDLDIIVNLDIKDLWNENLHNNACGAVLDCDSCGFDSANHKRKIFSSIEINTDKYFNSGVMLFDLDKMRQRYHLWDDAIEFLYCHPEAPSLDQSALNYILQNDCMFMPVRYNWHHYLGEKDDVIYHFGSIYKPWQYVDQWSGYLYWVNYFFTPWYEDSEVFFSEYRNLSVMVDDLILSGCIYSRKKFLKNIFIRLLQEFLMILNKK